MTENENGQQPQSQLEQPMRCLNKECGKDFVVMNPVAEIINKATVSMIVWSHPEVQCCPHCGIPYQFAIKTLRGVEAMWGPVRTQGQPSIVVPPPGFKIPRPS